MIMVSWAVSGIGSFLIIFLSLIGPIFLGLPEFLGLFVLIGQPYLLTDYLGFMWPDKLILIASLIVVIPPSILYHLQWRWKKAVDENLPTFLRDVANAQYTGMTFIRALEYSADREYGPLSEHLKWAIAKISWGIPYEEALRDMADRVGTTLVRRAMMLIIETGRTGGDVREIMESIAKHIKDLEDLNRDRFTSMRPNVYIIYLGFIVMIGTITIMYNTFIVSLLAEEFVGTLGTIQPQASPIMPLMYQRIYFHTSAIIAFLGGLIAGQMGEGAATNGLKHSVIMLTITLIIFMFFIV